ncbi:MAG TPA: hypothetical protein VFK73_07070 [Paludibacter sp.]|nr:hypothetical protein [Paludibacter sp.]
MSNNPSEWLLFKQKVANRINLIKNPTPVYPQWQLDCVTWLKNNGYIASPHNPDENVTFTLFGYMMNNKWTKLNPIQPIDYLTQYGYIKNWHDGNELISMKTFGYIVSNKLKETITTTPIDYLLSKGIITQPRNPDETVNFWLLGAMLSNANKKGIRI